MKGMGKGEGKRERGRLPERPAGVSSIRVHLKTWLTLVGRRNRSARSNEGLTLVGK